MSNFTQLEGGFFISFEGGEGSGKTSQINLLSKNLAAKGYKVQTTREPGGTPEAESIRDLLVQRDAGNWCALSEILLLFAARTVHVEQVIKPALQEDSVIISDRFVDSTRAYQGYGHGFDLNKIEEINSLVLGDFEPGLTFILDIPPEEGLQRSMKRLAGEGMNLKQTEDRFEKLDSEFHHRLTQGFLDIAKKNPERCVVIDATQSIEKISETILETVLERLS